MKQLRRLLVALYFLPITCVAQWKTYVAPISQWGHTAPVAVYTPKEYVDSVKKKYPVILFFHGKGEAGTDINKVLSAYLPKRIRDGWEPKARNPLTNEIQKFIVIAAQDMWGTPWPNAMRKQWDWLIKTQKLRIDSSRIYVTGLSLGGAASVLWGTYDTIAPTLTTAIVSASPNADIFTYKVNIPNLAKEKVPIWFWSGTKDGFTNYANDFTKQYKAAGGEAFVQTFDGGHCCWDDLYNGTVKTVWNGLELNIYEWFLTKRKGGTVIPPKEVEMDICLPEPSKILRLIIMYKDGSYKYYDSTNLPKTTLFFPELKVK